ncbi:peroxide stress protein YaaA [Lentimicrobium sp.]|jgi:cytoplasmic iron level regulating protein YaaA (DUF328/UPF0246 family)|uniref:peroxide stress protein YaaA n=1 Tax=Lentimicrobium sp. TaxID=2034841 RepID=UPI002CABEF4E|nr:peroxide stress protein YaaA [Lentimicrobium sp.]MCO5264176.1 peroxide stress protein YaaA [Lentimicrobium sp.]HPF65133.1 peroxide stress protein YaaA [Lentimicrobium sp.]HPJ61172.1 peroxide stress protein YaaA [Lentimicrobium sp.]
MLIIISPSKTLDFENKTSIRSGAEPEMISRSKKLVSLLKKKTPRQLAELMDISPKLAELNALRYSEWTFPFPDGKSRPALAAFKGDVYEGLKAWELTDGQIDFADDHLRILSGLYGILKPTDLILPYRLEMGTALHGKDYKNLYQFWGESITKSTRKALRDSGSDILINLASDEYAKAIDFKALKARIITPAFREFRDGKYKFVSFNAKRARGLMTRFAIDRGISDPDDFKHFDYEGYGYMEGLSKGDQWVFVR